MRSTNYKYFWIVFALTLLQSNQSGFAQTDEAQHAINVEFTEVAVLEVIGETELFVDWSEEDLEGLDQLDEVNLTDNALWLNYTTIAHNGVNYKITALCAQIPQGFELLLTAANPSETGGGTKGLAISTLPTPLLQVTVLDVVHLIGSAYTGVGEGSGVAVDISIRKIDPGKSFSEINQSLFSLDFDILSYQ